MLESFTLREAHWTHAEFYLISDGVGWKAGERTERRRAGKKQVGRTISLMQYIRKVAHIARKWYY